MNEDRKKILREKVENVIRLYQNYGISTKSNFNGCVDNLTDLFVSRINKEVNVALQELKHKKGLNPSKTK